MVCRTSAPTAAKASSWSRGGARAGAEVRAVVSVCIRVVVTNHQAEPRHPSGVQVEAGTAQIEIGLPRGEGHVDVCGSEPHMTGAADNLAKVEAGVPATPPAHSGQPGIEWAKGGGCIAEDFAQRPGLRIRIEETQALPGVEEKPGREMGIEEPGVMGEAGFDTQSP